MDDGTLNALQLSSLRQWIRDMAPHTPGGSVIELDGVSGSVVPSVPRASIANSVSYDTAARLEAALPELTRAYDEAGVAAWTVWIHESDSAAIAAAEANGNVLDGRPMGMGMELADLVEPAGMDELDWERDPADVAGAQAIMAASYGFGDGVAASLLPRIWEGWHLYLARHDGRPACSLMACDVDGDCIVTVVGTIREARGKGLARRLMYAALADFRDRGTVTATLQATAMGHPIYAALGYRDLGRMLMYERRKAA